MRHYGPYIPTCASDRLTLCVDGIELVLNVEQSYLFTCFNSKETDDSTFNINFWKTLHPKIHKVPRVCIIKRRDRVVRETDTSNELEKHRWAYGNGTRVRLINYKTEHPHLFVGRGRHPLRGSCKFSVNKNDVIINRFNDPTFRIQGFHHYVNKPDVNWTACWKDPLTRRVKYITLSDSRRVMQKFDQARALHSRLYSLRKQNLLNALSTPGDKLGQLALATHLIDRLGIRIGNEKDPDVEVCTTGCCSLEKYTHVNILHRPANSIRLTFVGKDSIPFDGTLKLSDEYFAVVERSFRSTRSNLLFDKITPASLNNYLQTLFPNLTAKVFRTCIASSLFQNTLFKTGDLLQANRAAATVCNHRRMHNGKYVLNTNTSRMNYIDPRIYFSFIRKHPEKRRCDWFKEHRDWAGSVSSYVF
jgi:DNA topoisomerase IB